MVLVTTAILLIAGSGIATFGGGYLLNALSNVLHGDEKSEADIVTTLSQESPALLEEYYSYKSTQGGFNWSSMETMLPLLVMGLVGIMALK